MKTLYPVKGCGRCADITAASLLGADVYDVMLDHLNNHQFFPSRYADVERLAIKARRSTKRQKIVIDFNLSENEVEALRVHLHNLVKSGKNAFAHPQTQRRRWSVEGRRLPEDNPVFENSGLGKSRYHQQPKCA